MAIILDPYCSMHKLTQNKVYPRVLLNIGISQGTPQISVLCLPHTVAIFFSRRSGPQATLRLPGRGLELL